MCDLSHRSVLLPLGANRHFFPLNGHSLTWHDYCKGFVPYLGNFGLTSKFGTLLALIHTPKVIYLSEIIRKTYVRSKTPQFWGKIAPKVRGIISNYIGGHGKC